MWTLWWSSHLIVLGMFSSFCFILELLQLDATMLTLWKNYQLAQVASLMVFFFSIQKIEKSIPLASSINAGGCICFAYKNTVEFSGFCCCNSELVALHCRNHKSGCNDNKRVFGLDCNDSNHIGFHQHQYWTTDNCFLCGRLLAWNLYEDALGGFVWTQQVASKTQHKSVLFASPMHILGVLPVLLLAFLSWLIWYCICFKVLLSSFGGSNWHKQQISVLSRKSLKGCFLWMSNLFRRHQNVFF